jgi:excisionase family DNA binding protein
MTPPLLLTIEDAARALAVSRPTVYRLIDSGALVRVKIGAAARVTAASVDAYVARLGEEARA